MKKYLFFLLLLVAVSCSRKHVPKATTTAPAKTVKKGPWPKTLTINDRVAKKSVDGRLYFDLEGKRYWKNYKDGKYYLYDQSMYGNPDFKPR